MLQPRSPSRAGLLTRKSRLRKSRAISRTGARDAATPRLSETGTGRLDPYYYRLLAAYGAQGWWPAESRLEVILGAILTQNTNWRNAALAIGRLREAGLLSLESLRRTNETELASLIRSAGFFRQKARTIVTFVRWLEARHDSSLRRMFSQPADHLRPELLKLRGLGPETADAILLYAGNQPVFVADAYSRRILARHGMLGENAQYEETQAFIHRQLERNARVYNEFHALLVETGKRHCKRTAPSCAGCPLEPL